MFFKELSIVDKDENECKFVMDKEAQNRICFVVILNGKKFPICKLSSMRNAMDTWALIELLLKKPKIDQNTPQISVNPKKSKYPTTKQSGQFLPEKGNDSSKKEKSDLWSKPSTRPTKRVKK
jgi:hypothetical protein